MNKWFGARDVRLFVTGADGEEREVTGIREIKEIKADADSPAGEIMPAAVEIAVEVTPEAAAWLRYVLVVRRMLYEPLEYRLN